MDFWLERRTNMDKNEYATVNASIYCCTINDNWNDNGSYKWINFTPDSANHLLCYQGLHIKNWSADYDFKLFINRVYDKQYYLDDLQRYAHILAKCKKYKIANALEIFDYLVKNKYDFYFLPDHPKFDRISNKCYCPFVKQKDNYYSIKNKTLQLIPKNKLKSFVNNNMFYLMDMIEN